MDKEKVLELAEPSKIALNIGEAAELAEGLESVLGMLENIKEFSADRPCSTVYAKAFDELREDTAEADEETAEAIIKEKEGSFTAPKVV